MWCYLPSDKFNNVSSNVYVIYHTFPYWNNVGPFFILINNLLLLQKKKTIFFKGAWSRIRSSFSFLFSLYTMLQECISNVKMKFESHSLSRKRDTGPTILWHLNKARALCLFTCSTYQLKNIIQADFSILIFLKHK